MATPFKKSFIHVGHDKGKITKTVLIFKAFRPSKNTSTQQLSERIGLRQPSLCRVYYNLVFKLKSIITACLNACKTTGKRVMHFALKKEVSHAS